MISMKNRLHNKALVLCASLFLGTSVMAQSPSGSYCMSSTQYITYPVVGGVGVVNACTTGTQCVEKVPGQASCVPVSSPTAVPALDFAGLGVLGLLSAGAGALVLRRRKRTK